MTEKDKMLAGKAYLASEEQLVKERQYAKQVLFKFNNMNPVLVEARHNLLRELLGQTKENFYFEPPFRCDYGYNIEIGNNFYANYNLTILDCAKVKIGDNVFIAPNVSLFTAGHPIHHEPRNQEYEYALPIPPDINFTSHEGYGHKRKTNSHTASRRTESLSRKK